MGSKPQLVYWDVRGLCEPIRYILRYLNVDFEDKRLPLEAEGSVAWAELKQSEGLDFPNLPYFIDGDLKLSQSLAILRHISRKHNLYGDTEKESATLDMIEQYLIDLQKAVWVVYNDKNFHAIKEDYKKTIPSRLGELEKFMEGKNFILGSKVSGVDFLLYETIEWFRVFAPEVFKEDASLQSLEEFQQRIEAIPQIKEYINSDKYKSWPLFGPVQYFGFSKDPEFKPLPFSYKNWVAKYPLES
ncbi:Glutathione S-transferase [Orchesella cincta]|uniref:glutathione transferase n=1 Tax=Orchesella cincta TaxID=48709 RepID=A0A1D2MFP8_ORCCI|nr:Glutathione S-transferase [Orchesella cincta]